MATIAPVPENAPIKEQLYGKRTSFQVTGDIESDWQRYRKSYAGMAALLPSQQALHSTSGAALMRHGMMEKRRKSNLTGGEGPEKRQEKHMLEMQMKAEKNLQELELTEGCDEATQRKKLELIKQMPTTIQVKKMLRTKLLDFDVVPLTGCASIRESQRQCMKRAKNRWHDVSTKLTLWRKSLKTVESHFGAGILSYFTFLKWLLFLNIYIFLMTCCFIILPGAFMVKNEIAYNNWLTGTINDTRINDSAVCSLSYDNTVNVSSNIGELMLDFLQGTGWMEQTQAFMGHYPNSQVGFYKDSSDTYNIPLAYLWTSLACLILSLAYIVYNTAGAFRESVLNSQEERFYQYCNKVFAGWDFVIEDEKSGELKKKSIHVEIKSDLEEERDLERRKNRSTKKMCGLTMIRLLVNLFVLVTLGASAYLIYWVANFELTYTNSADYEKQHSFVQLLVEFLPSVTITLLNVIVPLLFMKIVLAEDYLPHNEMKITLVRTVFLRLASLGVLIGTIYLQVNCSTPTAGCRVCENIRCWETYVGQQLYKLVIMDFLVVLLIVLVVEPLRKLIVTKCCKCKLTKMIGLAKFEIPKQVLDLVYSQTLCWLGAFFSPVIPAMCVIKFFIFFYLRKLSLLVFCEPPDRPYRASRSTTFFMTILLVAFILVCVPIGFIIIKQPPSYGCGPFRIYDTMWDIVTITIGNWPSGLQDAISFISSAGFVVPLLVIVGLSLYYWFAVARANQDMVKMLKEQLMLEGQDKQFLMAKMNEFTGGKSGHAKKPVPRGAGAAAAPLPKKVSPPSSTVTHVDENANTNPPPRAAPPPVVVVAKAPTPAPRSPTAYDDDDNDYDDDTSYRTPSPTPTPTGQRKDYGREVTDDSVTGNRNDPDPSKRSVVDSPPGVPIDW